MKKGRALKPQLVGEDDNIDLLRGYGIRKGDIALLKSAQVTTFNYLLAQRSQDVVEATSLSAKRVSQILRAAEDIMVRDDYLPDEELQPSSKNKETRVTDKEAMKKLHNSKKKERELQRSSERVLKGIVNSE